MGESLGQQYALQVAVQTMKERCLQLQQRLSLVEDENMQLRMKNSKDYAEISDGDNKSETELLREKVAQLTKQKSQLTVNVLMVATENRQLWNRLSKLTQANQSLGNQLTKLSDSINQGPPVSPTSPSNLIRSRTFTHETPPPKLVPKLDKEIFVDTSLEDISLKILNNIAQEKTELEKQCAQMTEMQTNDSYVHSSLGFAYPKDDLESCDAEIVLHMEQLKYLKDSLLLHREKLKNNINLFKKLHETGLFCKSCKKKSQEKVNDDKSEVKLEEKKCNVTQQDKICPMCTKDFSVVDISEFVKHVEGHFTTEDTNYMHYLDFEMLDDIKDAVK